MLHACDKNGAHDYLFPPCEEIGTFSWSWSSNGISHVCMVTISYQTIQVGIIIEILWFFIVFSEGDVASIVGDVSSVSTLAPAATASVVCILSHHIDK